MRRRILVVALAVSLGGMLWLLFRTVPGYTRLELADPDAGRTLASFVLREGEPVVLTWRNSMWGLDVTEAFIAKSGLLIQTEVTFAQPDGPPPPPVHPQYIDGLYHIGGAFSAKGLARPLHQVVYRVGEIGRPKMLIRDRAIEFKPLVGFGGRVVLTAVAPVLYEVIAAILKGALPACAGKLKAQGLSVDKVAEHVAALLGLPVEVIWAAGSSARPYKPPACFAIGRPGIWG